MNKPPKVCAVVALMAICGLVCCLSPLYAQGPEFRRVEPKELLQKKADKVDLLYNISRFYLAGATTLDMASTVHILDHPTVARRQDGSLLAYYHGTEEGWAGFLGKRDARKAVAANVALNIGLTFLSRKLYRKGGHWRDLAIIVNLAKGTDNLMAGIHNVNYSRTVDGRVGAAMGYSGPILWSH